MEWLIRMVQLTLYLCWLCLCLAGMAWAIWWLAHADLPYPWK